MVQDARNFKYSSDYPMPLVTYRQEFTISAPTGDTAYLIKEEHHLPYTPLVLGKWSSSQDFTQAQDISSVEGDDTAILHVLSDDTYIYFVIFKNPSKSVTRYVRLIGFVPPDYNGDIQPITNDSLYRFDSDYDYIGLYKQGILNEQTGGMVTHGLGYIPQCKAWAKGDIDITTQGGQVISVTGFSLIEPSINRYANTGRLAYFSVSTKDKFIAQGKDIEDEDYSLNPEDKIYYHIYTKEA